MASSNNKRICKVILLLLVNQQLVNSFTLHSTNLGFKKNRTPKGTANIILPTDEVIYKSLDGEDYSYDASSSIHNRLLNEPGDDAEGRNSKRNLKYLLIPVKTRTSTNAFSELGENRFEQPKNLVSSDRTHIKDVNLENNFKSKKYPLPPIEWAKNQIYEKTNKQETYGQHGIENPRSNNDIISTKKLILSDLLKLYEEELEKYQLMPMKDAKRRESDLYGPTSRQVIKPRRHLPYENLRETIYSLDDNDISLGQSKVADAIGQRLKTKLYNYHKNLNLPARFKLSKKSDGLNSVGILMSSVLDPLRSIVDKLEDVDDITDEIVERI